MRRLGLAGLLGACLATSHAYAADLFGSAPPPMDAPAQTELGSNWYIRGDVGYGIEKSPVVDPAGGLIPPGLPGYYQDPLSGNTVPTGYNTFNTPIGDASSNAPVARGNPKTVDQGILDVGFGYRINDFLRVEATYNFFRGPGFGVTSKVVCPGAVTGVDNYNQTSVDTNGNPVYTAVPIGYVYPATTCNGYLNASQFNNLVLGSAYLDLGKWWILQPYIGAGVGLNANTMSGSVKYSNTSDGSPYTGVTTTGDTTAPPIWVTQTSAISNGRPVYTYLYNCTKAAGKCTGAPNVEFGPQNWNRNFNSTKYTIAGQVSAGVGIPISQSAMLDVGYKFTTPDIGHATQNYIQSINVGVRYNIN